MSATNRKQSKQFDEDEFEGDSHNAPNIGRSTRDEIELLKTHSSIKESGHALIFTGSFMVILTVIISAMYMIGMTPPQQFWDLLLMMMGFVGGRILTGNKNKE